MLCGKHLVKAKNHYVYVVDPVVQSTLVLSLLIASSGVLRTGVRNGPSLRYAKKKFCESIELRTIESTVSQIL